MASTAAGHYYYANSEKHHDLKHPPHDHHHHQLSPSAIEALQDFTRHLKYYGKEEMDQDMFEAMLDDMGYSKDRPRQGLFDSLLTEVQNAVAGSSQHDDDDDDHVPRSVISVQDMYHLYQSEPYRISEQAVFSTGEALMNFVEGLFFKADTSGDNSLDAEELREFMKHFLHQDPSEEDLAKTFQTLDADHNGRIDFEEFKNFMLRANWNDHGSIIHDFHESFFSTSHTSTEELVQELESYALSHRAVTHHFITNIACASFGKTETADILLRFLSAYKYFNSDFVNNLEKLIHCLEKNPKQVQVLKENWKEEMGIYNDDTLADCERLGISRESIIGIPHKDLFVNLLEFVEQKLQRSYVKFIPEYICKEMNDAVTSCVTEGTMGLLALLYFGSELIVPNIYSAILQGLKHSIGITNQNARFLLLHIDIDKDHAECLRNIIIENCVTKKDRLILAQCSVKILDARVSFYDSLIKYNSSLETTTAMTSTIYNNQANKWSRSEPVCLSDFTGRPVVFEMCKDHVKSSMVLDVGCGEGYVSRKLIEMGAMKIVGVDISSGMIQAANTHPLKEANEYYIVGDVTQLKKRLLETSNQTNLMQGAQFELGFFDLSVAVFVFNYMTITDMEKTFRDVFSLLKPGGHFVFSVPHPFMASHNSETFGFGKGNSGTSSYFGMRDQLLEGHICTITGERLKVRMYCKTFEDYFRTAQKYGFDVIQVEEARVKSGHLEVQPSFFESVNGVPLHLVIKLRKPKSVNELNSKISSSLSSLSLLPKKIHWSRVATKNIKNAFIIQVPALVKDELYVASLECFNRGIDVESLDMVYDFSSKSFTHLKKFAFSARHTLLHETGIVLLRGLDLDIFGKEEEDHEKMIQCSKIAYYLLCNHIGTVDGAARGKLFDVKNKSVNALDKTADNVLFSVSDCEANWHTDGASRDRVYDAVGLLCIHQSRAGGKSKISNACDAYDAMLGTPKFVMHELLRPICRDILENATSSKAKGSLRMSMRSQLGREESLMSLRISYNSYPIYEVKHDRLRFRYMRHWIETAHRKMSWQVPTLLRIAMDMLDDELDKRCCFHDALERGDILICNNGCIAHGRDAFTDAFGDQPRHLVRCWIQMQKFDLMTASKS